MTPGWLAMETNYSLAKCKCGGEWGSNNAPKHRHTQKKYKKSPENGKKLHYMFSHAKISKFDFAIWANKYVCSFYVSAK